MNDKEREMLDAINAARAGWQREPLRADERLTAAAQGHAADLAAHPGLASQTACVVSSAPSRIAGGNQWSCHSCDCYKTGRGAGYCRCLTCHLWKPGLHDRP